MCVYFFDLTHFMEARAENLQKISFACWAIVSRKFAFEITFGLDLEEFEHVEIYAFYRQKIKNMSRFFQVFL